MERLCYKDANNGKEFFSVPGGGIEEGESPEQTKEKPRERTDRKWQHSSKVLEGANQRKAASTRGCRPISFLEDARRRQVIPQGWSKVTFQLTCSWLLCTDLQMLKIRFRLWFISTLVQLTG